MGEPSAKTVAALEAAVAAVKAAKVPKDLRVAAFNAAFYGSMPVQTGRPDDAASNTPPPPGEVPNGVGVIAVKLEIDPAQAARLYDIDGDGVHLTVKRSLLDSTKKGAQCEIAYLVLAGRQALGEEWTQVKAILDATESRGVKDTNTSRNIGKLDGDGLRMKGPDGSRELKINDAGYEKASAIAKRLTEAS